MPDEPRDAKPRLGATTLSEDACRQFIKVLASPRGTDGRTGRFAELHRVIKQREDHFYNRPAADQRLPKPHDDVEPYQTDILRQTHEKLKARLAENPFAIRVTPPRPSMSKIANQFETVLQRGFELIEEREDFSMQADLADGQIIQAFGVLHWNRADHIHPDVPDAEEVESLDGVDDPKRYREHEGRYVETSESRLKRHEEAKARAGFPYFMECPRADVISFIADRSMLNGMGMVLYTRTVPLVEYDDKLKKDGMRAGWVSLNQYAKTVRIYEEKSMPANYDPSTDAESWGRGVVVAQLWSRDEGYELVAASDATGAAGEFRLVKSWPHSFGMPPFAICRAGYTNHPDPRLAYAPALEGGYRLKPFVDRAITLHMAIAQQIALPFYYIKMASGEYMLDEASGKPLMLSRDALAAMTLPSGAEIVELKPEMNKALIESLSMAVEDLRQALPDTGFVEVGASTQPWTIRLSQDQANTIVKMLKNAQARTIQIAARSIARDMQEYGEPITVYAKVKGGKSQEETIVGIDPKDIPTLQIEVDIDPFSSAQAVANIEHMRAMVDDPLIPFDEWDFAEQALRVPDPDTYIEEHRARRTFVEQVWPASEKQELARRFGDTFVVTPDGAIVGPAGMQATPTDVLQGNGYRVATPTESVMPTLPTLNTPNTAPMVGMPG